MIPAFDDFGNLPPGIHRATMDEVRSRFGVGSPEREAQIEELVAFVDWATQAGIARIIVNGSFVTGKLAPQDVDVIVLPSLLFKMMELVNESVFPFIQLIIAADDDDLESWGLKDFGTDRKGRSKGVLEIEI